MELKMNDHGFSTLKVTLADREDGGVRVYSDDLPGLILSGEEKAAVVASISRAIEALLEYSGINVVSVTPAKPVADILSGGNPQSVDMHIQHFVVEYRHAA